VFHISSRKNESNTHLLSQPAVSHRALNKKPTMAAAQVQILRPSRVFRPHTPEEVDQNDHLAIWHVIHPFYSPEEGTPAPVPNTVDLDAKYARQKQFIWRHLLDPLWGVLYGTYPEHMVDHFQVMIGGWHRLIIHPTATRERNKYFFNWVVRAPYRLPNSSDFYYVRQIPDGMELEQACIDGNLRADKLNPRTWPEFAYSPNDAWLSLVWASMLGMLDLADPAFNNAPAAAPEDIDLT